VAEVMRYVLFKTHQTSGCPIKREELTGIVTRNYRQRALPALVINEARDRLAATFGYEMRELQRTRAPSTRSARQPPCKRNSFFSFLFPPSYLRHRSIHFQLMACHLWIYL
jgi:melanoma-associated antigen